MPTIQGKADSNIGSKPKAYWCKDEEGTDKLCVEVAVSKKEQNAITTYLEDGGETEYVLKPKQYKKRTHKQSE